MSRKPAGKSDPERGYQWIDQKQSEVLTGVPELSQSMPWPTLGNHSGPCCSSTSTLWGKDAASGSGESAHLEEQNQLGQNPSAVSPWDPTPSPVGHDGH